MTTHDDELVEQLRRVDSGLDFRGWTRRRLFALTVFVVLDLFATVVSGAAIFGVVVARHEACVRDNDLRGAYVAQWQPILDLPVPPLPPNPTDAQRQMYAAQAQLRAVFQDNLDSGFAQHSCTSVVDGLKPVLIASIVGLALAVVAALLFSNRRTRRYAIATRPRDG